MCVPEIEERSAAAAARTAAMISCWAGPLGAVRLLDRPSWLMALPRSSSPKDSRLAASAGASAMAVHASPRTYPSADASRALHLH